MNLYVNVYILLFNVKPCGFMLYVTLYFLYKNKICDSSFKPSFKKLFKYFLKISYVCSCVSNSANLSTSYCVFNSILIVGIQLKTVDAL